jgi:hypothetical protein
MSINENIEILDESTSTFHTNETTFQRLNSDSVLLPNKSNQNEKQADLLYDETIYGNNINIKKPWMMGKTFTALYIQGHPLIVIGPHCKKT